MDYCSPGGHCSRVPPLDSRRFARRLPILGAVALAVLLVAPLRAQGRGWTVARSASADLWFHGLAVSGFTGFGALPLYATGYADSVPRARRAAGTTTPLDAGARRFR